MCWEEFVKCKQSAAWLIWRRSDRFVLELQVEDNKSLTGMSWTLFLLSASKISSSSTTSLLLFFVSRVFGLVKDNLNHGDVDDDLQPTFSRALDLWITNHADDMSYKPICSGVFRPGTNNESWGWLMDFFQTRWMTALSAWTSEAQVICSPLLW